MQLMFCLMVTLSIPVWAEPQEPIDPKMAKQYIAEILSQPEFETTREESQWRYTGKSFSEEEAPVETTSWLDFFIKFIAQMFELLLWILLGVGIILFVIYGSRWLEQLRPQKMVKPDYVPTPRILNKDTTTALLPTNLSQQAWLLWQSGDASAAISLLYRGALSVLITRDKLDIDDSATENECLRLVKNKQSFELSSYFAELTRIWQNIAYAERLPNENDVQKLCQAWQQYFLL